MPPARTSSTTASEGIQLISAEVDEDHVQINSVQSTQPAMQRTASSLNRADAVDSSWGPLTSSDLKLLKGATGQDFNWPPKEGEGAPQAAFDLALARMDERARNLPWNKIGSAELARLQQVGAISEAFAEAAQEYLRTGKSAPDASPQTTADEAEKVAAVRPAPPAPQPAETVLPTPVQDGKLYL